MLFCLYTKLYQDSTCAIYVEFVPEKAPAKKLKPLCSVHIYGYAANGDTYGYAANGSVDPYSTVARSLTAGEGSLINTWPSRGRLPLLFPVGQSCHWILCHWICPPGNKISQSAIHGMPGWCFSFAPWSKRTDPCIMVPLLCSLELMHLPVVCGVRIATISFLRVQS